MFTRDTSQWVFILKSPRSIPFKYNRLIYISGMVGILLGSSEILLILNLENIHTFSMIFL